MAHPEKWPSFFFTKAWQDPESGLALGGPILMKTEQGPVYVGAATIEVAMELEMAVSGGLPVELVQLEMFLERIKTDARSSCDHAIVYDTVERVKDWRASPEAFDPKPILVEIAALVDQQ